VPIADLKTGTADGKAASYETPRALETSEIPGVVDAYRQAAKNALAAGFDGVEVHGANGYLIEQFLQSHTNLRTDQYGGSIPNRTRFLMEVTQAVVDVWGADRVGVRLSPYGVANGSGEPDPMPLYTYAVEQLNPLGLAYLHFIEPCRPRRGQPSERAVGDGAVSPDLEGHADRRRRLHRRDRGGRDPGWPCRRRRVRPHLHFQPGPAAPAATRFSADAL
jgi:N-ethylmaleimide reductase